MINDIGGESYMEVERKLIEILAFYAGVLKDSSVESVQHYVSVAEVEMAYESFILSLADEAVELTDEHRLILLELGSRLFVSAEPVFRSDFLQVAEKYLNGLD